MNCETASVGAVLRGKAVARHRRRIPHGCPTGRSHAERTARTPRRSQMQRNMISVAKTKGKYLFMLRKLFLTVLAVGVCTAFSAAAEFGGLQENDEHWVGTWSTTLHAPELLPGFTNTGFKNQTLRQIVHISMGGQRVRLRLSTFGANGLVVDDAHIALSAGDSSIVAGSDRALTFGGKTSIVI